MSMHKALLSSAFAAITMIAFSSVSAMPVAGPIGQVQDLELQQQLQQINDLARARGVVLQDLQVHRAMQLSANSSGQVTAQAAGQSCTVTAKVVIEGVGATISATASTCLAAARMIANFVRGKE